MKRLKKPLAVLLVVITLLSTFSITAFAAEYEISKFRLTKGEELNYGYSYFDLEKWEWVDEPVLWGYTNHELTVSRDGYGSKTAYCIDANLPAPPTGNYHITTSTVDIKDIAKTNGTKGLQGAEFVLYKTEADAQANTNAVDTQVSDENGLVSFKGLEYGGFSADEETKAANGTANGSTDYWIVETKAPNGYILFKDPIKITVNATSHNAANTDNVVNTPKFETPKTGGTMTNVTFIGSVLLLVGAGMFLATRRKKSSTKN